jgi:hypothetical protein
MSAAATAAGYLYASGRLRGRGAREQEHATEEQKPKPDAAPRERPSPKKPVRVAVLPKEERPAEERPKRAPRIEYRVRRWRPGQEPNE